MSKDFIHNNILQGVADAIRYCDDTTAGIAPVDYADRIRALDKLIPQPDALNFYMPNGGTISLNKTGSPTVVTLEYSLDRGATWTAWQEDANGNRSLTLTAGQKMYVRNTSETATRFSTSSTDYYNFSFNLETHASGSVMSLICKIPTLSLVGDYAMRGLFAHCNTLITPPQFPATYLTEYCYNATFYDCNALTSTPELPATSLQAYCYYFMFGMCNSLVSAPNLPATTLVEGCYYRMFRDDYNINNIRVYFTQIATDSLTEWFSRSVSTTGDFYCPAELTIPTGASGIPSGWTRHDLPTE